MEYKVGVISGDGIGPEIVTEAKGIGQNSRQVWTQLQLHRHPYGWLLN